MRITPILAAGSMLLLISCGRSDPQTRAVRAGAPAALPGSPQGLWLGGDLHVHNDHSSDGSAPRQGSSDMLPGNVSITDQITQGVLKGLDWMPLTDHRTYDQHYDPLWESADLLLIPGEEANGKPHSTVEAAVDTIVQGAGRPGTADFINLQQSIWDAHAQGANWSIAHPDDGELEDDGVTPNVRANAQGMDLIEVWNRGSNGEKEIDYAENRWTQGWRFGVAGGSDNHFRELWAIAGPGMPITSVFAADRSERAVVQGLQAGRTSIRLLPADPLITLDADFQNDGVFEALGGDEVIAAPGTPGKLRVTVSNGVGATVMIYKSPGRAAGVFKSFTPAGVADSFTFDITAEVQPVWYRAELRGVGQAATLDTNLAKSLTSDPAKLPALLQLVLRDTQNALRAICSPIFISPKPIEATPAIDLPADSGGDDDAQLALGETGSFNGFPALAVSSGVSHVVAETHVPGATRVMYRRRGADGQWNEPVDLAPMSASARFPRIAARDKDIWVVWQDERAGQQPRRAAIYLRHSADGGGSWQIEQQVRTVAGRAEHPDLALTADGKPALVWQEISAGNPFDVMAQIIGGDTAPQNLSGEGKTVTAATPLDTRSARYPASVWPRIAVASDGRLAVAWQDNRTDVNPLFTGSTITGEANGTDPDNWQIMLRTLAPGASTWSAPASLGADNLADRHPAIGFATDGTLAAAWDSRELHSSGVNLAVLSAISKDGGASWTTPAAIAGDAKAMSQFPVLGRDRGGQIRAVWYDSRSSDWRWRVMSAQLDTGGNWQNAKMIASRGVNTWPATDAGQIVFSSTRNSARLQRDRTQQIYLMAAP